LDLAHIAGDIGQDALHWSQDKKAATRQELVHLALQSIPLQSLIMVAVRSLLPIASLVSSPALVSAQCPAGLYAAAVSILSNYAPAQSYCSSKYPVVPKTVWETAYTTSITAVATSVGTTTVSTAVIL
jgi:hypothetical protein